MNYNYKAIEDVLNHIKKHPQQFDMSNFHVETSCGTVACVAGWTCILYDSSYEYDESDAFQGDYVCSVAQQILGLSNIETVLFEYSNSESEVITILERLVEQKDKPSSEQQTIKQLAHGTELLKQWIKAEEYLNASLNCI